MAITAGRILTVLCLVQLGLAGDMKNKDFEEPFGYTNWFCAGCVAVSDSDAYSGSTSLLASERFVYIHAIRNMSGAILLLLWYNSKCFKVSIRFFHV